MARKILDIATFGLAGPIFGGGKKREAAPAPSRATPAVMPVPDDERVNAARKRSIVRQRARRGRDSTILTSGTLGGG